MRRLFSIVILCGVAAILTGCTQGNASLESRGIVDRTDSALEIVAVDLVSVLGQLPDFDPWSMTVQVSPTRASYGTALIDALSNAGYGIQRVSADQGINHVQYTQTEVLESTGNSNAFEIEIRGVRIARNYERSNGRWLPISPVRIYGINPSRVIVYNELHADEQTATRFSSGVVFHDADGQVIESRESNVSVSNLSDDADGTTQPELIQRALRLSQASTFTRQRAALPNKEQNYRSISEVVLRFPTSNPSELGQNNKRAIADLLQSSNADTDRFVIQGCAHGKSLLWDGTESVSLLRQQRVNKELLVSGVDAQSIRELSCFANEERSELPQRSVSVVLERLVTPL